MYFICLLGTLVLVGVGETSVTKIEQNCGPFGAYILMGGNKQYTIALINR